MNIIFKIIGYIASGLLSFILVPQIYTTYTTKNVAGLSHWFLYFELLVTSLWIVYGIGFILEDNINGLTIIIANTSLLISVIILLILKNIYK